MPILRFLFGKFVTAKDPKFLETISSSIYRNIATMNKTWPENRKWSLRIQGFRRLETFFMQPQPWVRANDDDHRQPPRLGHYFEDSGIISKTCIADKCPAWSNYFVAHNKLFARPTFRSSWFESDSQPSPVFGWRPVSNLFLSQEYLMIHLAAQINQEYWNLILH